METYVFRHGATKYKQGVVTIDTADDLTQEGVGVVTDSVGHFAQRFKTKAPIRIHSSPFGRCLHTAKILGSFLADQGFDIKGIEPDDSLGEVKNFEYWLFHPLANGGEVVYQGEKFLVDRELTNPQRFSPTIYFKRDCTHSLSDRAKRTLPRQYLDKLASFERSSSVSARFRSKLAQLAQAEQDPLTILSTHEALPSRFVEQLVGGNENSFLDRGKYFVLRFHNGIWTPCNVQEGAIKVE